jgi:peptide/nickel transport system substrate-binding protein
MAKLVGFNPNAPFSRRRLVQVTAVGAGTMAGAALLAACGGATAPPTVAPAAPTQPPAPTAAPTTAAAAPTTAAPTATTAAAAAPTAASTATAAAAPTAAATAATAAATPTKAAVANALPQKGGVSPTPRNQTLIVDQSLFQVFDSFNPFIPNGQQYQAGFQQACKEFLFYANYAQGKVEPWLATGWKYNSTFDQLTITLNPKVHWNDGQPMTSADVKFSLEMLKNTPALLPVTDPSVRTFLDSVTAPDAQTVVIKLNAPNPRYHYVFICGIVGGFEVVPQHIWSKVDPTTFQSNPPVRTGPYTLKQVIPAQLMFVWQKDPNYWNKANFDPAPQYVVYRSGPVVDSQVNEFQKAQTDIAGFDYTHMKALQDGGYKNMQIETAFRDPCPRGIAINADPSKGVLADARSRWAISYLLDRAKIGSTIWLINTPPAQYPWADYKSNSQWENTAIAGENKLTYDPAKAAAMFDAAGATLDAASGKRMFQGKALSWEIMTPAIVGNPEYQIGQLIADELKKIGIDAQVRSYTGSVWTQKMNTGDFDINSFWLCGVSFDPNQLYTTYEISKAVPIGQAAINGNQIRLHDTALDSDAVKLDSSDPTSPTAKATFDKALGDYYKALPAIPVIQTTYPTAFNTTYWTNWPTDDNLYHVPANWWGQFLFTIGKIKATGAP